MLKSVKLSETVYKEAKRLGRELETGRVLTGLHHIPLSTAISFAVSRTLEDIERKRRFRAAAGAWKHMDAGRLAKEIYEARKKGTRWDVRL